MRFGVFMSLFIASNFILDASHTQLLARDGKPYVILLADNADTDRNEQTGIPLGASVIIKPRKEAVKFIREKCQDDYEILEEHPQSSEVGIAVPVGKNAKGSAHWFVRYRCKKSR